ncbi:STAS domain-containing protein [Desulfobacter sp.]|uniref:STAS domain-containing protein n=1 Tax=Desulfobacter sp. TaxID=2294 RepID=UPI003D151C4B
MQIHHKTRGEYLLIEAEGKLDANWSEHFTDTVMNFVREGHHHLIIGASKMVFLSSAGIRVLLLIFKSVNKVGGRFFIYNATEFVTQTLTTSGFGGWLITELPGDIPREAIPSMQKNYEHFSLGSGKGQRLSIHNAWRPWKQVDRSGVKPVKCVNNLFSLGIGSPGMDSGDSGKQFGEFLAAAGHVVYQHPAEESRPDYLIAEQAFIPTMQCIQALILEGEMTDLMRFSPTDERRFFTLSQIVETIMAEKQMTKAGLVLIGEVEGLVGASLIKSPGELKADSIISYPQIKAWLNFSGERAYARHQAVILGVVSRGSVNDGQLLFPMEPDSEYAAHLHAAVFPHQVLQNGRIDLFETLGRFFNGPSPLAVLHLVNDSRPVIGLGESALVRGACWFSPVNDEEVDA